MKLFGRRKAKEAAVQFNPETQYAVIRSSICTGEKIAGFKKKKTAGKTYRRSLRQKKRILAGFLMV